MANSPSVLYDPWITKPMPIFLVVLVAAHVFALAFWIYKLATDHKHRTKPH